MADVAFELRGVSKVQQQLREIAAQFPQHATTALREEAEIEMTEAKRRTPVDTSALKNSGAVKGPLVKGRDIYVELMFGGAAAPYAVYVHENLEAFHRVGQAKFLESTLLESAPHMASRLARRIRQIAGL